jgi:hypothetical protein
MEIPLCFKDRYMLNRATQIPIQLEKNKFSILTKINKYLAICVETDKYMWLENEVEPNCALISEKSQICKLKNEISNIVQPLPCEIAIFKGIKPNINNCKWNLVDIQKPMFIKLVQDNAWVYVIPEEESIAIFCQGKNFLITVENEIGILELDAGCQLKTRHINLFTSNFLTKNSSMLYSKINKIDRKATLFNNTELKFILNNTKPLKLQHLEQLPNEKLQNLIELTKETSLTEWHERYMPHFSVGFNLIIIILIVTVFIIIKKKRNKKKNIQIINEIPIVQRKPDFRKESVDVINEVVTTPRYKFK